MTWVEGEEIARGATAVVTRGAPGTVVKTLVPHIPAIIAQLEAAATRVATDAGLPVARLLEARLDREPPQLVLEHIDGVLLSERAMTEGPAYAGGVLAEVQDQVRTIATPALPSVNGYLGHQVGRVPLPPDVRAAAIADLAALTADPTELVLCHMDLHHLNVMWAGEPVIIDWSNAAAAPAAADVARTRLLLETATYHVPDDLHPHIDESLRAYLERTEQLAPGLADASRAWDRVIAAARLDERPPVPERRALLARLER